MTYPLKVEWVQAVSMQKRSNFSDVSNECRFDAYMTGACFARLMRLHEAASAGMREPVGELNELW